MCVQSLPLVKWFFVVKIAYRCKQCPKTEGKDVSYHVDKYGNESSGYRSYEEYVCVRASEACFFEKEYLKSQFADLHHCSSTMSGKAEAYNEAFRESYSSLFCEEFSKKHPGAEISKEEDIEWEEDDDQISEESQRVKPFLWEMSRYFPPSPSP